MTEMTGTAGPGPALGRGDAGLAQPHHGVTLPLPVHPARPTQTQARPRPGGGQYGVTTDLTNTHTHTRVLSAHSWLVVQILPE